MSVVLNAQSYKADYTKKEFKDSVKFDKRPIFSTSKMVVTGDTDSMLSHYIHRTDTATMLGHYIHRTDTAAMLGHYIHRTDTATMLTDYVRRLSTASTHIWAVGGATLLATSGTDTAPTSGARFWVEMQIPYNVTITGIAYMVGSAAGSTDSVIVQLYNSAGTSVATSKTTGAHHGVKVGTAANMQSVAFSTPYVATAGQYFVSVQFNGTTARFRSYPVPGSPFITGTVAGTYDVTANITPGTSFAADKGPICLTY